MKRFLSYITALALVSIFVPLSATATPPQDCAGYLGDGTQAEPFLVTNQADLALVSDCDFASGGGVFFRQTTDIVLTGDWTPLGEFTGSYDGDFQSISGLNVNDTSSTNGGLFAELVAATIKNLSVVATDIIAQSYAGIISGRAQDVVINNVRVKASGTMSVIQGAGCLLGAADGDVTISDVYADCNTAASTKWSGGLVAVLGANGFPVEDLSISRAYVRGDLSFSDSGGGIAAIFTTTDLDAQISGFAFAGNLLAPNDEEALVGGLFGSAGSETASTPPVTTVTNSSVRGTLRSELVTEQSQVVIQPPPQITLPPLTLSSFDFQAASAVDYDDTVFRPSPTVGKVYPAGNKGSATPRFVLSNMILAPKYGAPSGSDGYIVNVGTPIAKGSPNPQCVFHIEPPRPFFDYEQTAFLTLVTPIQIRDLSTFTGCLSVADGIENLAEEDLWVKDPSIFLGDVWSAQLVHMGLDESTLDYGGQSFEIAHNQTFSLLNDSWNYFPEFSVSPSLPAGITLDSNTGRIQGAASEAFEPTTFTITRTSQAGFATQTTQLTLSQLPNQTANSAATTSYQGPVIESVSPNPVQQGEELVVLGQRLEQVTQVTIGESVVGPAEITAEGSELRFVVPEDAATGQQAIVFSGGFGSLVFQNGVEITEALAATTDAGPRFEVREMANGDLKLYAFGIVNQGKIQFMVNGKEMAWVRATSTNHKKLRSVSFAGGVEHYLVRTLKNPGGKTIEFYQNSELMHSHN